MCRSCSEIHSPMRYEVTISKISGLRRPGARPPGPPGSINCLTSHLKYLFDTLMRLFRAQTCAPAAHDCALGGAPERRGAFGPRPAARDPKRCIRAVRATKIERTRTADMRSLARAANQQGERARLVGGQAPWSQFLRGHNSWPLGSNGTCTVALTKRLDHMK